MTRQIETQNNQSPQRAYSDAHFHPYADDEISLIDLGKVLYKRLWVIILVGAIVSAAALAFALMQKPTYRYISVLQVGSYMDRDNTEQPIEASNAVVARLQSAVFPSVFRELIAQNDWLQSDIDVFPGVSATAIADSNLIMLSAVISDSLPEELSDALTMFYQQASERLSDAHSRLIANRIERLELERAALSDALDLATRGVRYRARQSELETQRQEASRELEYLLNEELALIRLQNLRTQERGAQRERDTLVQQEQNLRAAIQQQEQTAALYRRQIERASRDIDLLQTSRRELGRTELRDPQQLSSLMLIDSQILSSQQALRELEQALYVELVQEAAALNAELVNVSGRLQTQESRLGEARQALREFELLRPMLIEQARAELSRVNALVAEIDAEQEAEIIELNNQILQVDNRIRQIVNTEVEVQPFRESQAQSTRRSLILALGLVLGGILGIMAAFFAEFGARVRQSLKEDQQV